VFFWGWMILSRPGGQTQNIGAELRHGKPPKLFWRMLDTVEASGWSTDDDYATRRVPKTDP